MQAVSVVPKTIDGCDRLTCCDKGSGDYQAQLALVWRIIGNR